MYKLSNNLKIHYSLRVASAMCFIGHGVFGIITKPIWCNYFALFGIGNSTAYRLMPLMGTLDIILGIVLLFKPIRAIGVWLLVWGFVTALCRPLSGEPIAECIERAGNFGAPLALLVLAGGFHLQRGWFLSVIDPGADVKEKKLRQVIIILRIVVFLLMAGHGWLNLLQKPGLLSQYSRLGFSNPANVALLAGIFELMAAVAVLVKPARPLIFFFIVWKMGSELFYPHFELLEWVERGGSYGTLLALWYCLEPVKIKVLMRGSLTALPIEAKRKWVDR
jgi:hypothetical protein